jgi:cytochrome P450
MVRAYEGLQRADRASVEPSGMKAPVAEPPLGVAKAVSEVRAELRVRPSFPPGETGFSLRRTHAFQRDTLRMLLGYYERFGPIFTFRSLHRPIVAMIGPEANHFVTVSGASNFSWRQGMFGEQLTPLIGDGLITTDWEYHDRARRIMMPAFHRRRMDAAVAVMAEEAELALEGWTGGRSIDLYAWIRELAMSIAMRALVGLDPRDGGIGREGALLFEDALSYYDAEIWKTLLRGPGTPWARMQAARRGLDRIIYAEIEHRRARGESGADVLSMLLDAEDEDGEGFTATELRDQLMHLLFGGHDTSSSTVSFLFYELARNPSVLSRLLAELDQTLGGRPPTVADLVESLPYLQTVIDETLRLYPPVWFGPRRAVSSFSFGGYTVPAGTHIIHSAWVSHHLPDVFPNPEAFIPERFVPEAKAARRPGAYIPFGAGSRICIGKRFGQLVVGAVAATVLQRFTCELTAGYELRVAKVPTLSPEGGLTVTLRAR